MLDKVHDLAFDNSTLVIITSDNGGTKESHDSNGELRAFKTQVFEGGIRVPMIMRWPGYIKPNSRDNSVILSFDLFPMIAEIIGDDISHLELHGHSFLQVLLGIPKKRTSPIFWENKRSNRFFSSQDDILNTFAVRKEDWKLVFEDGKIYLFDMNKDISEKNNLAEVKPFVIADLLNEYLSWRNKNSRIDYTINIMKGNVGVENNNLIFHGDNLVILERNTLFDFNDGDFTFTATITPNTSGEHRIVAQKKGSWLLQLLQNNFLELHVIGDNDIKIVLTSKTPFHVGQEYDVAFSVFGWQKSNSTIKLYINNQLEAADNNLPAVKSNDNPILIGNNELLSSPFIGEIDDIGFYTSSLNQYELTRQ